MKPARQVTLWYLLALIGLLGACKSPFAAPAGQGQPSRDLARPASSLPAASVPESRGAPQGKEGAETPAVSPGRPQGLGRPVFRTIATFNDFSRDAGVEAPPYADLISVTLEDSGGFAGVSLNFSGDLPTRLREGEVMGIGVDFYRDALQQESDHQLFADGGTDGWFAYLQTPEGFVIYPGDFFVGGRIMRFEVPWSALGSPSSGRLSVFADWSQTAEPLNRSGEDHAPDFGSSPYSR